MTKVESLSTLLALVQDNMDYLAPETAKDLIDFCTKEIEMIQRKTEKASKKSRENDILYYIVAENLPTEYTSIPDIAESLIPLVPENVVLTAQKVVTRLNALVKEGLAEKVSKPIGKANRVHYRKVSS